MFVFFVVWDPHHQSDIVAFEKLHKRAARHATGIYRYEHGYTRENMIKLGWEPLEERRARIKLNTFYKAKSGLIDIPFTLTESTSRRRMGTYAIPTSTVDSHMYSFYPNTIRLWNALSEEGRNSTSVDAFNTFIRSNVIRSTYI